MQETSITRDYIVEIKFGIIPGEYTQDLKQCSRVTFNGSWQWGEASGELCHLKE